MPKPISLETKLPLALCGLILAALVVLTYVAYRHVRRAELDVADVRVRNLTHQFGSLLEQSVVATAAQAESTAGHPLLAQALLGGAVPDSQLRRALLTATDTGRVAGSELWDAHGHRLLVAGRDTANLGQVSNEGFLGSVASPERGTVGPLLMVGDSLVAPSTAPVRSGNTVVGYVVRWHYLTNSEPQRRATLDIIGPGASLLIGSPKTGVWTDLTHRVPAPPVEAWRDTAAVVYESPGQGTRIAAANQVRGSPWVVQIELSQGAVLAPARQFIRRFALIALGVLGVAFLGVWLLVRRITVPLRHLTAVTDEFSQGQYGSRAHVERRDELGKLGGAFNHMAQRVQETHERLETNIAELKSTREQFAQAQRLEAVGRLAGGIAHDFNNLLTVILGETELALEGKTEDHQESLQQIKKAGERASELTRQLLAFSRRQLLEPTVFNLNDLIRDLDRMIGRLIGEDITLVTRVEAGHAMVRADRGQVEQVIMNLVVNARDAMPNGGRLVIETRSAQLEQEYADSRPELAPGEYVLVTVTDTGTGMSEDVKSHIFEPFFTTKDRTRGTGLGLATSYGIAKQAGGHLAAYTELGVGTTMRLYLPVVAAQPRPAPVPGSVRETGEETVLLVEDDPGVRKIANRILSGRGYRVLEAAEGDEALNIVSQHQDTIHLLLSDVVLPGLSGRELAARIREQRPGIRVLFASGYTDDVILQHLLEAGDEAVLQKPFTEADLSRKVRAVLDG